MRILLADDDPDQLAIREMLVLQLGFEPVCAGSAETALAAAREKNPECALLDLRLPDESAGWKLVRDLKRLNPELRIWLLTGATVKKKFSVPEQALVEGVVQKGRTSIKALLESCRAESRDVKFTKH
jgi:CheY-like chemotaxis protein